MTPPLPSSPETSVRGMSRGKMMQSANSGIATAQDLLKSSEPSQEEVAEMRERLQELSPELQTIAMLRFEGYTYKEIAARLGCSEQTVLRKIKIIKSRWRRLLDSEP